MRGDHKVIFIPATLRSPDGRRIADGVVQGDGDWRRHGIPGGDVVIRGREESLAFWASADTTRDRA